MKKYAVSAIEEEVKKMKDQRKDKELSYIKKLSEDYQLSYYKCRRDKKGHCFKYDDGEQQEKMTLEEMQKYFHLDAEAKRFKLTCA